MILTKELFFEKNDAENSGLPTKITLEFEDMYSVWNSDDLQPEWRIWIATRKGVLTDRELILFAVDCIRRSISLSKAEHHNAIRICYLAEKYANCEATPEEIAELEGKGNVTKDVLSFATNASMLSIWCRDSLPDSMKEQREQSDYLIKNCKPVFDL